MNKKLETILEDLQEIINKLHDSKIDVSKLQEVKDAIIIDLEGAE